MQIQLSSLYSGRKRHANLKPDGESYNNIQEGEGEEGYESDADEPLDADGAGADVPLHREVEGENDEVGDDGDGQPAPKWMRVTADAGIALIGLGAGLLDSGRISRSSSRSSSVFS